MKTAIKLYNGGVNHVFSPVIFTVFATAIIVSIFICFKELLIERNYSIFTTEEQVEAAQTDLIALLGG